jgi:hypothetical protein
VHSLVWFELGSGDCHRVVTGEGVRRGFAKKLVAVRQARQSRWLQQRSKITEIGRKRSGGTQRFIEHKIDTKVTVCLEVA